MFTPILGRSGSEIPPDVVLASILAVCVMILSSYFVRKIGFVFIFIYVMTLAVLDSVNLCCLYFIKKKIKDRINVCGFSIPRRRKGRGDAFFP